MVGAILREFEIRLLEDTDQVGQVASFIECTQSTMKKTSDSFDPDQRRPLNFAKGYEITLQHLYWRFLQIGAFH